MRDLIPVELADGTTVWALVDSSGPSDVALGRAPRVLKGLSEVVRGVATNVRDGLAAARPDEVSVEFGIELAVAETGLVAALAGLDGNVSMKVQLTWTSDAAAPSPR